MNDCILIDFAPQRWGTLERFQNFYAGTYSFPHYAQRALSGSANNLRKASLLLQVAREHAGKLSEDSAQLEKYSYTPGQRGRELSALIEAILLGLYSSIDCARKIVTHIYRDHRGVKQSTRKFFQAVTDGKVATTVPAEIRDAFATASWYNGFRQLRDALTHSDIGHCHLDEKSSKVAYTHAGLGTTRKALVVDDIFAHLEDLSAHINQFMGKIFHFLNGTLKDEEVSQMCGIFNGRVYSRKVRPSEAKDFDSGRCTAFKWFEKDEKPTCPLVQACGAYAKRYDDLKTNGNDQDEGM